MSIVLKSTNDNVVPATVSPRRLIARVLLGLTVVALPNVTHAGIFDFLRRDRDEVVEIIETHHSSDCRCRPRCSHPQHKHQQKHQQKHTTPQTAYRPTPQPQPQPQPQLQPRPSYTTPQVAAQPTTPVRNWAPPAPPTTRYAVRPNPGIVYRPTPTYRTGPSVIYQRETVVGQVPVTTWQTQWVDQGSYRMVWVSRPALRQVPRTSYRQVIGYRVVPYQRMTPTTAGRPTPPLPATPTPTRSEQSTAAQAVPNPLAAQPVSSSTTNTQTLRPTTAHRVWQARGRLGR